MAQKQENSQEWEGEALVRIYKLGSRKLFGRNSMHQGGQLNTQYGGYSTSGHKGPLTH
jgi:hypothetical protein